MKRILQFLLIVTFGVLFAHTSYIGAQEVPAEETCVVDGQQIEQGAQEEVQPEEEFCEEDPVVLEQAEEPIDKGVPSIETVAGTDAELADVPAVLGESTEVLAETGTNSELTFLVGGLIVLTVLLLFSVKNSNKLSE